MIALKSPEIAILITNTNVHHNLAESEYSTRKKQCEKAAEVLGQNSLRDVTLADLKGKLFYLTSENKHFLTWFSNIFHINSICNNLQTKLICMLFFFFIEKSILTCRKKSKKSLNI